MNLNAYTSRVESFVDELRGTDWERQLGEWTITLLVLAATWWFAQRLQKTAGAVLGEQELPGMWQGIGDMISAVLFFPLSNFVMILYAALTYCFAVGLYRAASRWYTADSPWRRFVLLYGLAGLLIPCVGAALVNGVGVAAHVLEGETLASALRTLDWSMIGTWPVDFLPAAVVVAGVASWRRGEFELTARRRRALAVAAVVIVVAPAVLGAVGVGVTANDSRQDPLTNVTAADLDDGYSGPDLEELEASDLERGAYQPASSLLGCGDVEQEAFATPYLEPEYAVSSVVNVSEPGDANRPYLEVAPYRNESGDVVHGTYAYRIADSPAGNWTLLDDWTSNRVNAEDSEWGDSAAGMTGAWGKSRNTGTLALENVRSATVVIDVVSPDGEIVRVRYRLCREGASNHAKTAPTETSTPTETAPEYNYSREAASLDVLSDGETNQVQVTINEMPPENQYPNYGLWEGCTMVREFNSTGTYTQIVSETNVKLVRLGDYRAYGYHDFAPDQADQCPPN